MLELPWKLVSIVGNRDSLSKLTGKQYSRHIRFTPDVVTQQCERTRYW